MNRHLPLVLRAVIVGIALLPTLVWAASRAPASAEDDAHLPLEEVQAFAAAYRAIKDAYVDDVDDHKLMRDAIRGMMAGLDPHSEYLDTDGLTQLDEDTTGEYGGLGIEVLFLDGALRVISPIDDTPASRAGIKSGDIIVRIDGQAIPETAGGLAVEQLRGKPGSKIALTIAREGEGDTLEFNLRREIIHVASVKVHALEPGYGYVRITQFQQETAAELREKLRRLIGRLDGAPRGVVLDLRSNPGGLLNAAVEVSDAFLDAGVIVSTRGRATDAESSFSATRGDLIHGAPMVVLIDHGTASAAEIVAGALKDHRRAVVMGTRSFGKGSVQTVLPLDSGAGVKLTTARYYTPAGVSIQATGIKPDIALGDAQWSMADRPASPANGERDLPGHLLGEGEFAEPDAEVERDAALDSDYALAQALNMLKGLALARERGADVPAKG
jgi:carboxyl-terminal processing protease